jgi:hypothetical protein
MKNYFQFNMDVIKRQIHRWQDEFNLVLSQSYLCNINLQRDFKTVGLPLKYAIVLLSESFNDKFIEAVHSVSDSLLDDDFIKAYIDEQPVDWRNEWHIEPCTDINMLPAVIEFDDFKVQLIGSAAKDKDSVDIFIKNIMPKINLLYQVVRQHIGGDAYQKARQFLSNNPSEFFTIEDIPHDLFNTNADKVDRYKAKIIQAILLRHSYGSFTQKQISEILKKH